MNPTNKLTIPTCTNAEEFTHLTKSANRSIHATPSLLMADLAKKSDQRSRIIHVPLKSHNAEVGVLDSVVCSIKPEQTMYFPTTSSLILWNHGTGLMRN